MSQILTDKFPFCIVADSGVGDGTIYPVATTRAKSSEWFWRVKKWTVEVTLSGSIADPGTPQTAIIPDLQPGLQGVVADTERDLVCWNANVFGAVGIIAEGGSTFIGLDDATAAVSFTFFSPAGTASFPGGVTPPPEPDPWDLDGIRTNAGSDYPQFYFAVTTAGDDIIPGSFHTYDDGVVVSSAGSILDWDGSSVRCYTEDLGAITGVTLAPQEWWPYAPTSGGDPVFDSATGAQINPNVVID